MKKINSRLVDHLFMLPRALGFKVDQQVEIDPLIHIANFFLQTYSTREVALSKGEIVFNIDKLIKVLNFRDWSLLFFHKYAHDYVSIALANHKLNDFLILNFSPESGYSFSAISLSAQNAESIYNNILFCAEVSADNVPKISLVQRNMSGLYLKEYVLNHIQMDLRLNYGNEFVEVHYPRIIDKLNTSNGCYVFPGAPGTGKSYFLQHLSSVVNKKFLYMPESVIMDGLDSPHVIELLIKHPNSVLIIEDGEKFITSRAGDKNSFVASILNASDGLLGSIINSSIIITHNQLLTDSDIDPALLRKGRLQYSYTFNELSIEDATNKLRSMGLNYTPTEPMTLGDIYNMHSETNYTKSIDNARRIGF